MSCQSHRSGAYQLLFCIPCYIWGLQKSISEHSRRPHWVPFLTCWLKTGNRSYNLHPQNWTMPDWTNVSWSCESQFLVQPSDSTITLIGQLMIKDQSSHLYFVGCCFEALCLTCWPLPSWLFLLHENYKLGLDLTEETRDTAHSSIYANWE